MSKQSLIALLKNSGAVKHGEFILKSGEKSSIYIDLRLPLCQGRNWQIGAEMAGLISRTVHKLHGEYMPLIVGVAESGIALMCSILNFAPEDRLGRWRGAWISKTNKEHGNVGSWQGHTPTEGQPIVIVEDVITGGGSVARAIDTCKQCYPNNPVILVACVVNRRAINDISEVPVISALNLDDLLPPTS